MKIGLMIPPSVDSARVSALAQEAEAAGYDYLCCGEHVFFHGPVPNAFVSLAAAAGATETIGLLSALTILPMYPAALAAKMIVTLDRVSHGRFELGVGVGGEYPPEFEASGVDVKTRGSRTDESLHVLRELFAGGRVAFDGKFTHLPGLELDPAPYQAGGPPIWIGGRKSAAIRRTGQYGDVWLPYLMEPQRVAEGLAAARAEASRRGRRPEKVQAGYFGWSAVHASAETARTMAVESVSATYNQDFSAYADRFLVAGNPEQVAHRIRGYAAAGASRFVFSPACSDANLDATIKLFSREVLPALRADEAIATTESENQE